MQAIVGAIALVIFLLASPPPPRTTPALATPPLTALLERHRRVMGRLPDTSARWTGTLTENGIVARYESIADGAGRYKRIVTLPIASRAEGDDGRDFWSADQNGNVQTRPATEHLPMEARLTRLNDALLAPGLAATVEGTETIDGRAAYAVRVATAGRDVKLYLDVESSLVDGADIGSRTIRYRAYRRFDGVPVPTLIDESDEHSFVSTTVDSVTFGHEPASAFASPAQREPDFPAGKSEIPVSFDSLRGLIVLNCTADGRPLRLLLDSGSSTSIIDMDAAKRLGLPTGGISRVEGAGLLEGTLARIERLDIGGIVFHPLVVQAVPLQLPAPISHSGIEGVLGYDAFAALVVRIAYSRGEVRLIAPARFRYGGTGTVAPLDTQQRVGRVEAILGGSDKGTFTVDTGSDASLVLYREFADAHFRDFINPFDIDQRSRDNQVITGAGGAGGQFVTRVGRVSSLSIGSFGIGDVLTEVVLRPTGAFSPAESDGLIGAGALSAFSAVFLDYPGKRLILER